MRVCLTPFPFWGTPRAHILRRNPCTYLLQSHRTQSTKHLLDRSLNYPPSPPTFFSFAKTPDCPPNLPFYRLSPNGSHARPACYDCHISMCEEEGLVLSFPPPTSPSVSLSTDYRVGPRLTQILPEEKPAYYPQLVSCPGCLLPPFSIAQNIGHPPRVLHIKPDVHHKRTRRPILFPLDYQWTQLNRRHPCRTPNSP